MDALALTTCYPAFIITDDVPEVYMHQFWNYVYKHDTFYRFTIDKKKRFKLTLEVFRDIFQIFPRVQDRDFDALPSEEDTISFLRDLGHAGVISSLDDVVVDQMHQTWRTFAALINRSLSGKTSALDKLHLYCAQILWGMYHQKYVDYVELLWEDFTYQIDNKDFKKQEKMYYPRFTKVIIHHFLIQEKTLSWRNKIGMHTSKDDYLINTLRFVSRKEASQIYRAVLPECLTSPEMKESKAYKTYLGYATGAVPPKIARKFKKASPTKKDSDLVPVDEEPVTKGKRIKRSIKKSSTKPATGIELLPEVALTEKAQLKEVRKKSLRDFHKTHPSGSGTVTENPPSVEKITPTVISEGTGDKPGVPDVTEDDSTESESKSWGNDEDDSNDEQESKDESSEQENESEEQESDDSEQEDESDDDQEEEEFVHTPSPTDDKDDENLESEDDEIESDEDKGMDDTTDQFDDDVDARLKEPTQTDKEVVQGEGADAEMIDAQQGNENLETTQEQVVEDAHVTISTVTKKTEVPATSSSRSSDLASKFLNFLDIPHTDAEIVSPLDVHVHHEVPRTQAPTLLTIPVSVITESSPVLTNIPQSSQTFTPPPILTTPTPPPTIETTNPLSTLPDFASVFRFNDRITALEKEVAEIKKDPLHTQVTSLVDEHLDTRLGETIEEFMNFFSESLTTRIKEQVKDQLPQILPKEVSNFALRVIEKLIKESRDEVTLAKVSSQPQSTYEAASTLTEFELKKILLDKMEKNKDKDKDPFAGSDRGLKKRKLSKDAEPTTSPKKKDSKSGSSKSTKSQPKSSESLFNQRNLCSRLQTQTCHKINKGIWVIMKMNQGMRLPLDVTASTSTDKSLKDFDELISTPIDFSSYENPEGDDYPFDLSKPLPLITRGKRQRVPFEFFINNDLKYLQGGISTMTYTTSTTKTKAAKYDPPGIEDMVPNIWSPVKVAYDRYALWGISHWRQQRKSFYAYARGIQSRGDVYSTKHILAVTHVKVIMKHGYGYLEEIVVRRADNNRLINLSGDDVADFAIALRMFTRSLVIQKRVEDLQLGVENPQGFIYDDDYKRNRLMRSDKLYKFSDGTLTRFLSSLEDITKNINMEYLSKRRWSTLEKKRAYFMIKDNNKLLEERRMMRSLEKFVGGRLYGTDLRLLQRTI
ncbi:hypothetical protein Tco_0270043 [Tanacetum coccineum]